MENKIRTLYELNQSIPYISYYSHTREDMYKIDSIYTEYNKLTHVLCSVNEGLEKALDLAIEQINKDKSNYY